MLLITGGHFGNPTATSVVQTWDRNFEILSSAFHVVAVEKLGQGYTANPLQDDFPERIPFVPNRASETV
ncbi:hypothetical protein [Cupriavidus sp. U2]|uniref:hypothetical protein n=1 Tax=Cupriavidus sp. U2 TaxID=2920269 RepID=UPI00129EDC4A|nr:hypothetical protein [Cupriavidus sp. U2]